MRTEDRSAHVRADLFDGHEVLHEVIDEPRRSPPPARQRHVVADEELSTTVSHVRREYDFPGADAPIGARPSEQSPSCHQRPWMAGGS